MLIAGIIAYLLLSFLMASLTLRKAVGCGLMRHPDRCTAWSDDGKVVVETALAIIVWPLWLPIIYAYKLRLYLENKYKTDLSLVTLFYGKDVE